MIANQQHYFAKSDFPGADEINAAKGSFLLMEGDSSGQGAYLVLDGEVEVFVADMDGSETLLFTLHSGHLIGEMGLLGIEQRMACVRCLTDVRLLRLSRQVWKQQMQNEVFLRKLLDSIVLRFSATQSVVRRLGQSQALSRLGVYMLGRSEWEHMKGDVVTLELPTHANLARMLNCTREHVTKMMKRFVLAGAIVTGDNRRMVNLSRSKISGLLMMDKDSAR
ncbi:MAG: Crp/Fnr family transcriptional regulator [Mariprofundaceae bacterium]